MTKFDKLAVSACMMAAGCLGHYIGLTMGRSQHECPPPPAQDTCAHTRYGNWWEVRSDTVLIEGETDSDDYFRINNYLTFYRVWQPTELERKVFFLEKEVWKKSGDRGGNFVIGPPRKFKVTLNPYLKDKK